MDFTTPFKPGVDPISRAVAAGVQKLEDAVMAAPALIATATNATDSLVDNLTDLADKTKAMIPELPSFPALNLQAEITSLVALAPASGAYAAKLASITTSFGSAISTGGYSLDSIVSDGASALKGATGSLAAAIPNMELPVGATEAIELAKASILPDKDEVKQSASTFSTDETVDELKGIFGDAFATNALADSAKTLASVAETAGKVFNGRAERLAKELKEVQIQERLDGVIIA